MNQNDLIDKAFVLRPILRFSAENSNFLIPVNGTLTDNDKIEYRIADTTAENEILSPADTVSFFYPPMDLDCPLFTPKTTQKRSNLICRNFIQTNLARPKDRPLVTPYIIKLFFKEKKSPTLGKIIQQLTYDRDMCAFEMLSLSNEMKRESGAHSAAILYPTVFDECIACMPVLMKGMCYYPDEPTEMWMRTRHHLENVYSVSQHTQKQRD